jgi:hypothetical protein
LIDHRSIDSSCKSTAPVDSMMAVLAVLLLALLLALPPCGTSAPLTVAVNVGGAIVATTDRRFLSFNIDMAEFTGVAAGPGGPPLDLSSALLTRRLNDLAQVGGSYLRIGGGSQACQTYNLTHDAPSAWWPVTSPYCMTHNATTGEWQAKSDMVTMHSGQFDTIAALLRRSPGVSLVLGLNQAYGRAMLPGGAVPTLAAAPHRAWPCLAESAACGIPPTRMQTARTVGPSTAATCAICSSTAPRTTSASARWSLATSRAGSNG